jgi:hypothetical protein
VGDVITDVWHGEAISASRIVEEKHRKTRRWRTTLRMCFLSFGSRAIITSQGARSVFGLAFLAAFLTVTRQKKLYLVEFLPGTRSGLKGRIATVLYRRFLRSACRGIQVMTPWERDDYITRYNLPATIVHLIPLYYCDDRVEGAPLPPRPPQGPIRVMASGRNSCDWDTLLEAARGQGWNLTLVTSAADGARIKSAADHAGATLHIDIPRADHDALLAASDLFVLALLPSSRSAGQVRMMGAATYGLPTIASETLGLRGYEKLACAMVPSGDPGALRSAINGFVRSPRDMYARALEVQAVAATRSRSVYLKELAGMFNA